MMLKELEHLENENPEYFDINSPTQRVGGTVPSHLSLLFILPQCTLLIIHIP